MGGSLFNSVLYPNMHSQIVQIKNMNECSKQRSNVFNMRLLKFCRRDRADYVFEHREK